MDLKNVDSTCQQMQDDDNSSCRESDNDTDICWWDEIGPDLEIMIFTFFKLKDLINLVRVSKKFQDLVPKSTLIQVR